MNDLSDFQRRRGERPQIDLGALDFNQIRRVMRWGLLVLALILVWTGVRWAGTFYTDWLWFRELGQESVLVKIVTTRVVLFTVALRVLAPGETPLSWENASFIDSQVRPVEAARFVGGTLHILAAEAPSPVEGAPVVREN